MEKGAFLLYTEYQEEISSLNDEEAGRLLKAIYAHEAGQEEIQLAGPEKVLFSIFRRRLDDNREKYRKTCEKRGEAGAKGGNQKVANASKPKQKVAKANFARTDVANASKPKQKTLDNDLELDNELEGQENKEARASYTEPETVSVPPQEIPAIVSLPLNDKTEYPVTEEQCHEWAGLYPAVDVIQQLRNMRGWLLANPVRRKTKTGILRFVTGWLSKEQNKGPGKGLPPKPKSNASYDIDELEALSRFDVPEELQEETTG